MSEPGKRQRLVELAAGTAIGVLGLVLKAHAIGYSPWKLVVGFFAFICAVGVVVNLMTRWRGRRSDRPTNIDELSPDGQ